MPLILVAAAAIALIAVSLFQLATLSNGITISQISVDTIPATIFRASFPQSSSSPVVVIAHGFAGSQQLMQPLALTLARNGYIAITFDFAGHGRNPEPMPGGLKDMNQSTQALLDEIGHIVAAAKASPGANGQIALIGHSMASELVVQFAMQHPEISATVALSLFGRDVTADHPRDLLVVDGAWEVSMLKDAGFRIVGMAAGGPAQERVTYGNFDIGTARRLVLAEGAEHIGVLYSRDALTQTVDWLNEVFHRRSSGGFDRRGQWLGLLVLGLVVLALPGSRLLPVLSNKPLGAGAAWRILLPIALLPAILTPFILWKVPTDFLPILLGDYLVVHFALYGLLTAAALWLVRYKLPERPSFTTPIGLSFGFAVVALAAYYILALGLPIDSYVTSFMPTPLRAPFILAMFCGTAPYFLADEWLVRGIDAARWGYAFTKFCFLLSLVIAVSLNLQKLFFLIIIVPVILVLFVIYGLVSGWVYSRTHDPRVAALGNALALAWAIAVTFPVVS
jgi:pimeloyl-ACP methyl ester carboxylesterase